MKQYVYLVKRKLDGKKFVMWGNLKSAAFRPECLNELSPTNGYKVDTPWGKAQNIPCNLRYNSKEFHVIRQAVIG